MFKYDFINFFEEKLKEIVKEDRILDAGGGHPFQKYMAKYKPWFEGKKYETLDFSPKYNPSILGDIHNIPLNDEEIGGVLCLSVLEHLQDPKKAVKEMRRVLKKGGKLLAFTHFIYPYHARKGVYEDYYRFSAIALKDIFKDFSVVELRKQGGYFRAMMFFLPFNLHFYLRVIFEPIAYFLDKIFMTEKKSTTVGFYIYCIK